MPPRALARFRNWKNLVRKVRKFIASSVDEGFSNDDAQHILWFKDEVSVLPPLALGVVVAWVGLIEG